MLVLKLAGAKEPFTAAKRGDLTAAIVERGTIEPVDYADLTCKLKARGKENTPQKYKELMRHAQDWSGYNQNWQQDKQAWEAWMQKTGLDHTDRKEPR